MADQNTRPELSPSTLFATSETATVFLFPKSKEAPSGVWVTFKRGLNYGEKLNVQGAFFKGLKLGQARKLVNQAEANDESTLLTDTATQKQLKLANWIADWNFPNAFGKSVPWPASIPDRLDIIANLDDRVGDWLEQEIDKLSGLADLAEKADADSPEALSDPLDLPVVEGKLVPTR